MQDLFICLTHYVLPSPHCQEMYPSVYCLCGASELSQRVIEIQLSELDGDGEVGCSVCDSQWGEKKAIIYSWC